MISLFALLKYSVLHSKLISPSNIFDANAFRDIYAFFVPCFGLSLISSVGTTPGARGHALFSLPYNMFCRGHFEEGGLNNDALTHQ